MFTLKPGDFDSCVAVACIKNRKESMQSSEIGWSFENAFSVLDYNIVLFSHHD